MVELLRRLARRLEVPGPQNGKQPSKYGIRNRRVALAFGLAGVAGRVFHVPPFRHAAPSGRFLALYLR
jgi:hypothetical protein